ncbi:MAG: hypothetical protein H0T89_20965 [Deltaproteobacteria bacterium]|nr:hypothetical protein [Deltaproteobacteria bacterium]MDQ3297126.1 hypothetical protein [Myxococcota bacterium]
MARGLPAPAVALWSILIFGIAGVSTAHADRRPVAVIDLSGEPTTVELARQLHTELANHPDLQALADPAISAELYGENPDEDGFKLKDARLAKDDAEAQLARFEFGLAANSAARGQAELHLVAPIGTVTALYAQLAFVLGQAQLGLRRPAEAGEAFALAHRLDPALAPDPARYLPDIIGAFDAAKARYAGTGKLVISGAGRLWIDGKDSGVAPVEVTAEAGPHVVWLTGAERESRAARVVVEAGKTASAAIEDAPASDRVKVRRARTALRNAPDPAARATAMKQLADLVGVRDAVLLSIAGGKVIVQTWNAGTRDHAPGFSALRELGNAKPVELLGPLAPPRAPVKPVDPPFVPIKPLETRRWYQRRSVQASLVVGVLATVVGTILIVRAADDDMVPLDSNLGQAMRSAP